MLDINNLVGFLYYSDSALNFQFIRKELLKIVPKFSAEDMVFVQDNLYQGGGEATAGVANTLAIDNWNDFKDLIKFLVKDLGGINTDTEKNLFIISDYYNSEILRTIEQIKKINYAMDYGINFNIYYFGKKSYEGIPEFNSEEISKNIFKKDLINSRN